MQAVTEIIHVLPLNDLKPHVEAEICNCQPAGECPSMKVGDRVQILSYIAPLKHRKVKTGRIVSIDGAYINVRPSWCKWEVELYPSEIKVI